MHISVIYYLGIGFLKAIATYSKRIGHGKELFLSNYQGEGLLHLTKEAHEKIKKIMDCIQCGRCNNYSTVTGSRTSRFIYRGPTQFFNITTNIQEIDMALPYIESLMKEDLKNLSKICPQNIPFHEIVPFFKKLALKLKEDKNEV